jgi:hypothetical protein
MGYDKKKYDDALMNFQNRTFNGDLIKSRHIVKYVLGIRWPEFVWGFFNDNDMSQRMTEAGGSWEPLTISMWEDIDTWNKGVAQRHGFTDSNGCIKMGQHNICWRPRWFDEKIRRMDNDKTEDRLSRKVAASQVGAVNEAMGKKVAFAELEDSYERAKEKGRKIETTEEELAEHTERKLQVSVPAMPKKKTAAKRGPKPKAKTLVDKAVDTV